MIRYVLTATLCLLSLLNFAQVPNGYMENWSEGPVLQEWKTNSRPQTLPPWEPYVVRRDTHAFQGKYAAGLYANGMFRAEAISLFPVRYHPLELELWYQLHFPPCVNDSGFPAKDKVRIRVDLLNKGNTVDSGRWESSQNQSAYTRIRIPISQHAIEFDSCRIWIEGGEVYGGCGFVPVGTYFLIDAVSIRYSHAPDCLDPELACEDCGCPEYYDPVCGCDGITYGNPCEALRVGVSSWSPGRCTDTVQACIDSTQICQDCACPAIYKPVCGCDGRTYGNDCEAFNNGLTRWTEGACGTSNSCDAAFFSWYDPFVNSFYFNYQGEPSNTMQFKWDFGDGNSSDKAFVSHSYSDTTRTSWQVCLQVSDTSSPCSEQFCDSVRIPLSGNFCSAGFGIGLGPDGEPVFVSDSDVPPEEKFWLWGDSTLQNTDTLQLPFDPHSTEEVCQVIFNETVPCRDTVCIQLQAVYRAYMVLSGKVLNSEPRKIQAYPNPVKSSENLRLAGLKKNTPYFVKIWSLQGISLKQITLNSDQDSPELSSALFETPGLYLVQFQSPEPGDSATIKLVVLP